MKKNFKFLIGGLALSLLFVGNASVAAFADNGLKFQDEGKKPLAVTVSYYSDIRSRGVAWTTMEQTDGVLEVVAADSEENIDWSKAQVVPAKRKVEESTYYTYKAHVEDLTEDTYYYRVGSEGAYSDVGKITVDQEEDDVSFIYATDSQDYNEEGFSEWKKLVDAAYATIPDAQFWAMGGDIVNDSHSWGSSHDLDEWIYALDMPKEHFMNSVFMPVAGNHDDWAETFANRFAIDYQGSTVGGGYYSFDYANLHFAALNTNENAWEDKFARQLEWLKQDLTETDKQWKIVMLHKGPISTGDHSNDGDVEEVRRLLLPIMAECEVDMVLQGHDHVYTRSRSYYYGKDENGAPRDGRVPNLNETYITETVDGKSVTYSVEPEGTFYMTANYAGRKSYPPVDYDETTIFPAVNPYNGQFMSQQIQKQMFTSIKISGGRLQFNAYTFQDGKVELYDTYNVMKDTHQAVEEQIKALPNVDEANILDYENVKTANAAYNKLVPNALKKMDGGLESKLRALSQKLPESVCEKPYAVACEIRDMKEIAPTQECLNKIKSIRRAYADLSDAQKALVINYGDVAQKESAYVDMLYAQAVTDMAKKCKEDKSVSAFEVYLAYDGLTEAQKAYVDLQGVERNSDKKGGCAGSMGAMSLGFTALGIVLCLLMKKSFRKGERK